LDKLQEDQIKRIDNLNDLHIKIYFGFKFGVMRELLHTVDCGDLTSRFWFKILDFCKYMQAKQRSD
jgi:hypothetical protein